MDRAMSGEKPLSKADEILADALGQLLALARQEWKRDLEQIRTESRAAILEVKNAALEILLEQRAPPEVVARLRAIG
jgi:hypothetical protein